MPKRPREEDDAAGAAPASSAAKQRPDTLLAKVSGEVGVATRQVKAVARLLEDGNSLPFIARYRKEATGGLDEEQLRGITSRLERLDALEEQRRGVLAKLEKQGALSEGLKGQVMQAETAQRLDDLYLPHRPKRSTKASSARDKGLAPLAEAILRGGRPAGSPSSAPAVSPEVAARRFVRQPEVPSMAEALAGAQDILAEMAAELPAAREKARGDLKQHGQLVSQLSRAAKQAQQAQEGGAGSSKGGAKKQGSAGSARDKPKVAKGGGSGKGGKELDADTYALYHDFRCSLRALRPHQVLALNRGEAHGALSIGFEWRLDGVEGLCQQLLPQEHGGGAAPLPAVYAELVKAAVQSGVKRLLKPAIEREARAELTEVANSHAVEAFARNLRQLLLQPPLPGVVVLGVDPAFRTGCKLAVCDPTGRVLETGAVFPHPPAPEAQRKQAGPQLTALIRKHGVQAVAIGNGTASRETQRFVADTLAGAGLSKRVGWCVVSEAGASVYSACELASKELPGMDVSLRGAVSIARRLQDPLSELVKVPPESLGVGQYQHDLKASTLAAQLAAAVESAVNLVGVDLNAASPALLARVAGLNRGTAAAVVAARDERGPFKSRQELLSVKGLGPRTFQQCAGFLRVRGGTQPLDGTAVHPESYAAAEALVREACEGSGAGSAAEEEAPPRKKQKAGGGKGRAAGAAGAAGLTPDMLLHARPALHALLGSAGQSQQAQQAQQGQGPAGSAAAAQGGGGKSGPPGGGSQQGQQDGSKGGGSRAGKQALTASGSGGGGSSSGGGSSGRWVTGEGLEALAARLGVGVPTMSDIVESLLAPERDVRGQAGLESLQFKQALSLADLSPGQQLSGVVRNVVEFGAFADINVGQDGLIHVSEFRKAAAGAAGAAGQVGLKQRGPGGQQQQGGRGAAQADAFSFASVGDLVRVRVVSVDVQRRRIALAPA